MLLGVPANRYSKHRAWSPSQSRYGKHGRRRKQRKEFPIIFKPQTPLSCLSFWFINVPFPALAENQSALKISPQEKGKTRCLLFFSFSFGVKRLLRYISTAPKDAWELKLDAEYYHSLVKESVDAGDGRNSKGCWWWCWPRRLWLLPTLLLCPDICCGPASLFPPW